MNFRATIIWNCKNATVCPGPSKLPWDVFCLSWDCRVWVFAFLFQSSTCKTLLVCYQCACPIPINQETACLLSVRMPNYNQLRHRLSVISAHAQFQSTKTQLICYQCACPFHRLSVIAIRLSQFCHDYRVTVLPLLPNRLQPPAEMAPLTAGVLMVAFLAAQGNLMLKQTQSCHYLVVHRCGLWPYYKSRLAVFAVSVLNIPMVDSVIIFPFNQCAKIWSYSLRLTGPKIFFYWRQVKPVIIQCLK